MRSFKSMPWLRCESGLEARVERQHPAMTVGEDGCLGESPNSGDGEKQTIWDTFYRHWK